MYCIPSALAYLDAVHLVEGPAVLLVVFGVPEVPAKVVEDAKVVAREAVRHEVVVEVAVPRDGQRHHASLDGHPEQNTDTACFNPRQGKACHVMRKPNT